GHERQTNVAQDKVRGLSQDGGKAFLTIMSDIHRESLLDELLGDQRRGLAIVFDAQDRLACLQHRSSPPNGHLAAATGFGHYPASASWAKTDQKHKRTKCYHR